MREELDIPMPAMGPDYRVPRRRETMDPHTRRLALIACGIGGTLLLLVGAYTVTGHHRGGVPVIQADARPLRTKPDNPGGMQVSGQDESIMSGASAETQAALAPPPETPAPQALKAQLPAPQALIAQPPTPQALKAQAPAPQALKAQAPAPQALKAQLPPPPAAPVVQAKASPPPVPAPAPIARAVVPPMPVSAPMAAEAKPAAAKPAPPARQAMAPAPAATAHGPLVQLAALTTEPAALAEWSRLEKKMPDLLSGRKPAVSRFERDGHTFWRLRTSGFADLGEAAVFCERLKTKGAGCSVASF